MPARPGPGRWRRWVPPWAGAGLILLGFLTLAFASLVREAIAQMTLVVTLGTLAWIAVASRGNGRRVAGLLVLALTALVASQAARLTVALRDRVHPVVPAELVAPVNRRLRERGCSFQVRPALRRTPHGPAGLPSPTVDAAGPHPRG